MKNNDEYDYPAFLQDAMEDDGKPDNTPGCGLVALMAIVVAVFVFLFSSW